MDESEFRSLAKWQTSLPPRCSADRIRYLLKGEEQILQSVFALAPISKILDDICNALDCQIGNTVSLISVPDDSAMSGAEISHSAALFGLHIFLSVDIGAESGEDLGILKTYCCVSRKPSPREFQLIERQFAWRQPRSNVTGRQSMAAIVASMDFAQREIMCGERRLR